MTSRSACPIINLWDEYSSGVMRYRIVQMAIRIRLLMQQGIKPISLPLLPMHNANWNKNKGVPPRTQHRRYVRPSPRHPKHVLPTKLL